MLEKFSEIQDELKQFNKNIENLIEILKDTNFLFGKFLGYKVSYKEKD